MQEIHIRRRTRIRELSRSTLEAPAFQALEEARPIASKSCASFSFTSTYLDEEPALRDAIADEGSIAAIHSVPSGESAIGIASLKR
jgi:hypothetical protein